jgi:hypothetical protein
VNSTFRQVGIATGIAALGSIFSHQVASGIRSALAGTPAAGQAGRVSEAVTNGQIDAVLRQAPAGVRSTLSDAATQSFVDALNHITTIAAVIALVAGLLCLLLIRARDFEGQGAPARGADEPEPAHVG